MRRSKGFVENKAQSNAISPPYRAKASMVSIFNAIIPAEFSAGFIFLRRCKNERKTT